MAACSTMLKKRDQGGQRARLARGIEPMKSFGYRDLKGKGATDMYFIDQAPIEQIQQLLGHASKTPPRSTSSSAGARRHEPNTGSALLLSQLSTS
jgi:hypothetical protein